MDLTGCDQEPIHTPGAIQPHGLLLVADSRTAAIVAGAGDLEARFGADWLGRSVADLLGAEVAQRLEQATEPRCHLGWLENAGADAAAVRQGENWLVQLEPTSADMRAVDVLGWMDEVGLQFERAGNLVELCERAAKSFSDLTGYDRVMIYRFLDDDAGEVIAECNAAGIPGFRNHRFPGSDIPRQARGLYIRNRVRVIPDVQYQPQPIRPAEFAGLDLSDIDLRSVSPVHIQYLKNMGVGASASMSIVRDGLLWGLVACHNTTPRNLDMAQRRAAQLVAAGLARQIGAKEEAEAYRERIRIRSDEDALLSQLSEDGDLYRMLSGSAEAARRVFRADGLAIIHGSKLHLDGHCPDRDDVREVAGWVRDKSAVPFYTNELGKIFAPAAAYADHASGLLAVTISTQVPTILLWFRSEEEQLVKWAGNPHESKVLTPGEVLTPRASFDAWSQVVRGKSRSWTSGEVEGAHRLVAKLYEIRQNIRQRELSENLQVALSDKDRLIEQKDTLIKEVNHRVQNSIQLVMAFLNLQARASAGDEATVRSLEEAQRRLSAVGLVHRRLYTDDNVESVDLSRYLEELVGDLSGSMGAEWRDYISTSFAPIMILADNAVHVGLILVELVINAQKYAYGGAPGPIAISLEQHRARFRLIVADQGRGRVGNREGFGSRMLKTLVQRLGGVIEDDDNRPGLRVIFSAPLDPGGRLANSQLGSPAMVG
ncbi:histidine kinase dimerization/phosphoacceptor domain -containing protein [Novosphingobium sp. 9U]|uniref:histidine kinase dimerization/phosphoacceptor domain -containing protein n=1 Tax=Novosphingobium sp. 9U TaxID=2653158 RepID=UPI0012EEE7D7|nr:histidine kinase dimerization/phosphoacceptor domain -containing protein [Novosphingobium sp. 9U]VWX47162.1 Phytochrome, two-component sensor histidine kinase [Novosphingobium sp. 9U]